MSVDHLVEAIQLMSLAAFSGIAALSLRGWLRQRDPGRGYLALAIGALGLTSASSQLNKIAPASLGSSIGVMTILAFLVSGLALLLFRNAVMPFPRFVRWIAIAAAAGLGILSIGTIILKSPARPGLLQLAIALGLVAFWSVSVGEPSIRFWLVARSLPAVQRARLRALSLGYGGIVGILVAAVLSGSAASGPLGRILVALAVLGIAPLLYAGFAPPAWLRRAWRDGEQEHFRQAVHDILVYSSSSAELARRALDWATRLTGADAGLIAYAARTPLATSGLSEEEAARLAEEFSSTTAGAVIRRSHGPGPSAIVSPLATEHDRGVLVLLAGPFTPVFGADEVAWLAEYSALVATGLDRVRLVEEMSGLNQQLAEKVAEVSKTSTELEAKNRELEAFSYSVSHDLRAPLRAINGFAAILLDEHAGELSETARSYLQRVSSNGRHMGRLVDDLLAFSRLGRQAMKTQSVTTTEVVKRAWDQVSAGLDGRQVEIAIQELPPCQSDPSLLEQVFVNLLDNAVKYSRTRAVARIEVGARIDAGSADGPVYYVRDNGVGFDMRYANKLFGVFQRLHRAEEYEGTGVGLAIVQRVVQRHGGRVWAEAALNEGATFSFTLQGGTAEWQAAA